MRGHQSPNLPSLLYKNLEKRKISAVRIWRSGYFPWGFKVRGNMNSTWNSHELPTNFPKTIDEKFMVLEPTLYINRWCGVHAAPPIVVIP